MDTGRCFLAALMGTLLIAAAHAHQSSATVNAVVTDAQGRPWQNAKVYVLGISDKGRVVLAQTASTRDGSFVAHFKSQDGPQPYLGVAASHPARGSAIPHAPRAIVSDFSVSWVRPPGL